MMDFGIGSYGLGFLAGLLSTLSPCVLPIVPVLLGSAIQAHPMAPLALAAGLATSYAIVGSTLAWAGSALGMDTGVLRDVGAGIVGLLGLVLMSGSLQQRFALVTAGIGNAGNSLILRMRLDGLRGQFAIGLALGIVWSPCVGPTLGGAVVLASQGSQLPQVATLMGIFGIGAAAPILILAYASRNAMMRIRGKLMQTGKTGKIILGGAMVVISLMILTGFDKTTETWLGNHSPSWMTHLSTRY